MTVPVNRLDVAQTVTVPGQLVGTQKRMIRVVVNGRLLELNGEKVSIKNENGGTKVQIGLPAQSVTE